MAGRADAAHAAVEDHVVAGGLVLDPLQIRRLLALIFVQARNLDGVELQTARIIQQLRGLPLEGAQRASVEPEPEGTALLVELGAGGADRVLSRR
jgi:hypothetical protein